jgi:hypothetical protein
MKSSSRIQPKASDNTRSYVRGNNELILRLANASFHLPGNSWCEDWKQYIGNNHPLFGICYHNILHPGSFCNRTLTFISSIAFGMTISSILYLFFIYYEDYVPNSTNPLMNVSISVNTTIASQSMTFNSISVTKYQVILWTIGSLLHCILDFLVRHLSANACCKLGVRCSSTCDWMTNNLVLGFIISMAAMGSLFFFLRALFLEDRANPQLIQSAGFLDNFLSPDDASLRTLSRFLMSLAVELFLTWFAMYFLFVTVIFSGILGCCRIPFLGGRPYEIYASQLPK